MITAGSECKVRAQINPIFFDDNELDNYATSSFFLNVESEASLTHEFAYDDAGLYPEFGSGNDLPVLAKRTGQGVGFSNESGSYAMRIKLMARDTLYGLRIFFGSANASPDAIRLSVYHGSDTSNSPGKIVVYAGDTAKIADE